jgi:hypothetical protein
MFLRPNIHKYNWAPPERNSHKQIGHILIDMRSIHDVRSFRAADCNTDHYLAVAKCRRNWQTIIKDHQISIGEVHSQEVKSGRGQRENKVYVGVSGPECRPNSGN